MKNEQQTLSDLALARHRIDLAAAMGERDHDAELIARGAMLGLAEIEAAEALSITFDVDSVLVDVCRRHLAQQAEKFLADLRQRGVRVRAEEGRLLVGPASKLDPETRQRVADLKPFLLEKAQCPAS